VLPGVGHMVAQAAPDLVAREIDAMIAQLDPAEAANVGSDVPPSSWPGLSRPSTPFVHQDVQDVDAKRGHDD